MRFKSLKMKIILSSTICIVAVGIFSSLALYTNFTNIISGKNDHINQIHLSTVYNQVEQNLAELATLYDKCSNDLEAARAMKLEGMETPEEKRQVMSALAKLEDYSTANKMLEYVDKLMLFNEHGVMAQVSTRRQSNRVDDPRRVMAMDIFAALDDVPGRYVMQITPALSGDEECLALLSPVYHFRERRSYGWLYIEVNPAFITDILSAYEPGSLFVTNAAGRALPAASAGLPEALLTPLPAEGQMIHHEGRVYKMEVRPLGAAGLHLISRSDVTFLARDDGPLVFTALVVAAMILLVGLILSFVMSGAITRPLNRLTARIVKISQNDFSYDPDIEKGGDEIAQMGRVVNEMCASINNLLKQNEEMYIQRQNTEIALLQSQVNPHFLYNTLNSINWMATIQKNTGIANITRALSSLLRNLAKGVGQKITLGEELSLLGDYAEIQSIRYMETFRLAVQVAEPYYKYTIVKFTLQPLVENAIYHGIEPKGESGTIVVDAREEDGDLLITIQDDGVGMDEEEIERLLQGSSDTGETTLTGIGVANVHKRLQLVYGKPYGLTYESEKGRYTRVTVRIPKEV